MGFIRILLALVRAPPLDDPYFGRLVYKKMQDPRLSFWEAKRVFEPTGQEIDLFIRAPAPLAATVAVKMTDCPFTEVPAVEEVTPVVVLEAPTT